MLFGKKKAEGLFTFFAVEGDSAMSRVKDKKQLKKDIYNAICFPNPFSEEAAAFGNDATIVYPWEWEAPTAVDAGTIGVDLEWIWHTIYTYMKEHYPPFDDQAFEESATTVVSSKNDCAVFYFSL